MKMGSTLWEEVQKSNAIYQYLSSLTFSTCKFKPHRIRGSSLACPSLPQKTQLSAQHSSVRHAALHRQVPKYTPPKQGVPSPGNTNLPFKWTTCLLTLELHAAILLVVQQTHLLTRLQNLRIIAKIAEASFQMELVYPYARDTDVAHWELSSSPSELAKNFTEEVVTSCGSWTNTGTNRMELKFATR